jgi:hypothetical protein
VSDITYFQRYSQAENHATNNTLLILRYFYQSSPYKLQGVLSDLLGDSNLNIGLTFQQQEKTKSTVIDGLIRQSPFEIYIEAKRGGGFDLVQMRGHIDSIKAKHPLSNESAILLGLTKEPISETERQTIFKYARENGVRFEAVTFTQILASLKDNYERHEVELAEIVQDYESFLIASNLREARNRWLIVFGAGTSKKENLRYSLYYDGAHRPSRRGYGFLGLYHEKTISHVGAIVAIAVTKVENGELTITTEEGKLSEEQKEQIRDATFETTYYDLKSSPHRFYLVDGFEETSFRKESAGSLWGARSFDLETVIDKYDPRHTYSSAEVAAALKGKVWQ